MLAYVHQNDGAEKNVKQIKLKSKQQKVSWAKVGLRH